jgi:RNA polymerase-binding transcription factor DksA
MGGTDEASVEELRDDSLRLAENDSDLLENVRAALRRIDNSTFGRCIIDHALIEESRLRAVPWTPYSRR